MISIIPRPEKGIYTYTVRISALKRGWHYSFSEEKYLYLHNRFLSSLCYWIIKNPRSWFVSPFPKWKCFTGLYIYCTNYCTFILVVGKILYIIFLHSLYGESANASLKWLLNLVSSCWSEIRVVNCGHFFMGVKRQGFPSLSIDPLYLYGNVCGFSLSFLLLRLLFHVHFFRFIIQEAL